MLFPNLHTDSQVDIQIFTTLYVYIILYCTLSKVGEQCRKVLMSDTHLKNVIWNVSRREEPGSGQEGEDDSPFCINPPSSSFDGSCGSLKHSSSVDDIKSGQSYWEKRLQLRHSCTGEKYITFNAVQSLSCCFHKPISKWGQLEEQLSQWHSINQAWEDTE